MLTIQDLRKYVVKALQTDESGDANLTEFFLHMDSNDAYEFRSDNFTVRNFLEAFLVWSCGPRWQEFLDDPSKFDQIPPKS